MRRVQARWACRNAAEFVRFAIEFSDMVKEEAVPEGEAPVEEEHEGGDTVGVRRVPICVGDSSGGPSGRFTCPLVRFASRIASATIGSSVLEKSHGATERVPAAPMVWPASVSAASS